MEHSLKLIAEEYKELMQWKEYLPAVVKAIKEVLPNSRVYLVGSIARGDYDITSDVDVLVVIENEPSFEERVKIKTKIWEKMDELGVPWTLPVEVHLVGPERARAYFKERVVRLS
ncbi:DNA polymerase subunit beta [Ignicoccus pacificus DSM 13166]|uniref:DNA polymerase subunit beta n=1 Tax=Ignicoccus pacificus DSM 13166 TaxID=940294 RepID=A0A977K926_9CREN|nr:DNA polymerase subunit beta [Ignicoccus pacificus DSM 13166]